MTNLIERPVYLQKLIDRRGNGEVKIVTGSRRCGKSWLLSKIYKKWLLEQGVRQENIISVSFDMEDEKMDEKLLDPQVLKQYIFDRITNDNEEYYVFLDEVQEVYNFEKIVNGINSHENIDAYITGSNSKFLSSEIKPYSGEEVTKFVYIRFHSKNSARHAQKTNVISERILYLRWNAWYPQTEDKGTKSELPA